jgi:hypothetical protein
MTVGTQIAMVLAVCVAAGLVVWTVLSLLWG